MMRGAFYVDEPETVIEYFSDAVVLKGADGQSGFYNSIDEAQKAGAKDILVFGGDYEMPANAKPAIGGFILRVDGSLIKFVRGVNL